jgi:hypothetical protein
MARQGVTWVGRKLSPCVINCQVIKERPLSRTFKPYLFKEKETFMNYWVIAVIAAIGAAGGFMNVFLGDAGLHRPGTIYANTDHAVWEPGFLGVVIVGCVAAVGSWATMNALDLIGAHAASLALTTGDVANALIVGFGGAKWFKSEKEKDILQIAGGIAASKSANPEAAVEIATGTPIQALHAAVRMKK